MNYREGEACEDQQGPGIPHRNPTSVLPQVRLGAVTFNSFIVIGSNLLIMSLTFIKYISVMHL